MNLKAYLSAKHRARNRIDDGEFDEVPVDMLTLADTGAKPDVRLIVDAKNAIIKYCKIKGWNPHKLSLTQVIELIMLMR